MGRLHELLYALRYSDLPADGDYARTEIRAMFLRLTAENAALRKERADCYGLVDSNRLGEALKRADEMRKDAERYQWLRDNATRYCEPLYIGSGREENYLVVGQCLAHMSMYMPDKPAFYANPDAAIDAAMGAKL